MKRQIVLFGMALALTAGLILAEEARKPAKPAKKEDPFAAMMKMGAPSAGHKKLEALAGTWKAKVKFWMDPTKPPAESEGTAERKWILGERFLKDDFSGKAANMPFKGLGLTGYDNQKKKYTSMWVDSMTTSIWTSLGTYDAEKKTFTYTSEGPDPFTGMTTKTRDVIRILSDDHHVMESYKLLARGKEFKVLEIDYRRKK